MIKRASIAPEAGLGRTETGRAAPHLCSGAAGLLAAVRARRGDGNGAAREQWQQTSSRSEPLCAGRRGAVTALAASIYSGRRRARGVVELDPMAGGARVAAGWDRTAATRVARPTATRTNPRGRGRGEARRGEGRSRRTRWVGPKVCGCFGHQPTTGPFFFFLISDLAVN